MVAYFLLIIVRWRELSAGFEPIPALSSLWRARRAYDASMTKTEKSSRAAGVAASGVAFVTVGLYAAWALVQILVLNPLAAVPGAPLAQIYSDVEAAGQSMDVWLVVTFMAVGPLAMLALLVVAAARPMQWRIPAIAGLSVLTVGPLAYWWASVAPGMGLADTYFISGGDHSPWAWPLVVASAAALIALIAWGVSAVLGARRPGAAGLVGATA